jgi:hypothetical protein
MSTRALEARTPLRPRPRMLVCLPLLAAVLGAAIAWLVRADARDAPANAAARPALRALAVGDLHMVLPEGWTPMAHGPRIPGFGGARAAYARGYGATAAMALVPATDPSLLPAKVAGGAGTPRVLDAGPLHAYTYVSDNGTGGRLHVYAAPTTRGIATLACASSDFTVDTCDVVVRGLRVTKGDFLPLNRESAFLVRLPAVIATLDHRRGRLRGRLAQAAISEAGARAADDLAVAYAAARHALRPLVAKTGSATVVVDLLGRLRDDHGALAAALRAHDPSGFAAAAGSIKRDEARLQRLLARFDDALRGATGR